MLILKISHSCPQPLHKTTFPDAKIVLCDLHFLWINSCALAVKVVVPAVLMTLFYHKFFEFLPHVLLGLISPMFRLIVYCFRRINSLFFHFLNTSINIFLHTNISQKSEIPIIISVHMQELSLQ